MQCNSHRCGPLIHPTAIISPQARLAPDCEIGPFCVLEGRVTIGARTRLKTGVVIGGEPMDRKYQGEATAVTIGSDNILFEYATVHRATGPDNATTIGDRNFIMSYVHIAHNCQLGSDCVLTSGVLLGGYAQVEDGANIGGRTGVHQFCRIGRLAMVGAHSYVNQDIPPFALAAGNPCRILGINRTGLERAGFSPEKIALITDAFRLLFRSGLLFDTALNRIETELLPGPAEAEIRHLLEFCRNSKRGILLKSSPDQEGQ
ncbi:MAG: acyl-ACP--UDP-N-acetylglucosamine O-acyltransferase [candidate division WOR-3 bacterium]